MEGIEPLFRIRPEKSLIDEQNLFHFTGIGGGGGGGETTGDKSIEQVLSISVDAWLVDYWTHKIIKRKNGK
jgi:hypothetical protein